MLLLAIVLLPPYGKRNSWNCPERLTVNHFLNIAKGMAHESYRITFEGPTVDQFKYRKSIKNNGLEGCTIIINIAKGMEHQNFSINLKGLTVHRLLRLALLH